MRHGRARNRMVPGVEVRHRATGAALFGVGVAALLYAVTESY